MQRSERIGDSVLHHIVAAAHLAAEAVAAHGDGHVVCAIGRGLDEDGNFEAGEADGVDNAALFAEVGQGDDDAVDFVGVLFEELRAALRFGVSFDRAEVRLLRTKDDGRCARRLENRDDFITAGLGQVVREKAAITNYDSKGHFALRCHVLAPICCVAGQLTGVSI